MLNHLFNIKTGDTSLENVSKVETLLSKPLFVVKDSQVSSRVYKHWSDANILYSIPTESETRKWSRYSLTELMWLSLLQTIRDYGMPLKAIKTVRDLLCTPMSYEECQKYTGINAKDNFIMMFAGKKQPEVSKEIVEYFEGLSEGQFYVPQTRFELALASTLLDGSIIEFRIYGDQSIMIITDQIRYFTLINPLHSKYLLELNESDRLTHLWNQPSLSIPLNHYLKNVFTDINTSVFKPISEFMDESYNILLTYLRSEKVKSVTIDYGVKQTETIDFIERKDKQLTVQEYKRLIDKVISKPFQKVSVKTHDGKSKMFVVHETTTRMKQK
jgi:DNA-binding transcriptional MerR regulator